MNKSIFVVLCAVFGALLFAGTAPAAFIAYEPFDYTASTRVLGQANPSTGTPWRLAAGSGATDTTAINVASGNLTAPAGLAVPVGNSATINGNGNLSGGANRLAFNSASTGF